jgi:hypothetical protein
MLMRGFMQGYSSLNIGIGKGCGYFPAGLPVQTTTRTASGFEAESWQADIKMDGQQARQEDSQARSNRSISHVQFEIYQANKQ